MQQLAVKDNCYKRMKNGPDSFQLIDTSDVLRGQISILTDLIEQPIVLQNKSISELEALIEEQKKEGV